MSCNVHEAQFRRTWAQPQLERRQVLRPTQHDVKHPNVDVLVYMIGQGQLADDVIGRGVGREEAVDRVQVGVQEVLVLAQACSGSVLGST